MATVKLGKKIRGENLEKILIQAAEEIGLSPETKDNYSTEYKLGSVIKKQVYDNSEIHLKRDSEEIAHIHFWKDGDRNYFFIFPKTEESVIEDYLNAVSKRI